MLIATSYGYMCRYLSTVLMSLFVTHAHTHFLLQLRVDDLNSVHVEG